MCYLTRQQQLEASAAAGTPPSMQRVRPRWAGAAAATLLGALALAALLAPTSTARVPDLAREAAPPIASRDAILPVAAGATARSLAPDDGVPGADTAKAGAGNCSHGL